MTVNVGAQTFSIPSGSITLQSGGTYTIGSVYMYVGDTLKFTATYTPGGSNRNVDYGIQNLTGTPKFISENSRNGSMMGTVTAEQTGTHVIRIQNRTNSNGNITLAGGTCRYFDNSKVVDTRIIYDSSAVYNRTEANLISAYNMGTNYFSNTFGIRFVRGATYEDNSVLNYSSLYCPYSNACGCGLNSRCHIDHHKGAGKFLRRLPLYSGQTIGIVGHITCNYNGSVHKECSGLVDHNVARRLMVSTYSAPWWADGNPIIATIIQHELIHSIGVRGHCDDSTQECIMKSKSDHPDLEFNKLCTKHFLDMAKFKSGLAI